MSQNVISFNIVLVHEIRVSVQGDIRVAPKITKVIVVKDLDPKTVINVVRSYTGKALVSFCVDSGER